MQKPLARPLYTGAVWLSLLLLGAAPARAQSQASPVEDVPVGETYHVEGAFGLWFPLADITLASGGSGTLTGIAGTTIDLKKDLGLTNEQFPEIRLEVRPARRHKFRFQYIPISYEQTAATPREIIFNGQRYRAGLSVNSTLDWKALRAGYEYDFISTSRGFGGFLLEFKYTEVNATLKTSTAPVIDEFARARAPIPAVGGVGRVYVTPNVSVTGEVTGFKLPEGLFEDSSGHYVDVDIYSTYNFTENVGVQLGFRSFDVGYLTKTDTGSFALRGLFFGIVARY